MRRVVILAALLMSLGAPGGGAVYPAKSVPRAMALTVPKGFSGVVLVMSGAKPLLYRGYGTIAGRAVRRDDRFWIASAGKQFAAAAIMRLVERGRIRLDDSLIRFFPDAPADKASITIRQLLSHTSGLGQSYASEEQPDRSSAVARMLAEPLQGPPGSGFRYSNSNVQLAAAIVEVSSGTSYADYVRRELWRPASLRSTGFA
jgi:CubicO group peptidase (beta-lactamase class C family)